MTLTAAHKPALTSVGLLAGLALALGLRVEIGGPAVAQSGVAGLIFAACLAALSFPLRPRANPASRNLLIGLLAGLALCLPALAVHLHVGHGHLPATGYPQWALIVAAVAGAEEFFFRGALHEQVNQLLGPTAAVTVAAAAFAAIHLPLYGWHAVPLDFAVGLSLGVLRLATGGWAAPAAAHIVADWLSWWII